MRLRNESTFNSMTRIRSDVHEMRCDLNDALKTVELQRILQHQKGVTDEADAVHCVTV